MEDLLTIFIHINLTYQHTLLFTFMCSHLCVSAFLHTDVCTSVSTICTLSSILVCVCLITFVVTCFCHSASLLISSAFRHSLPCSNNSHQHVTLLRVRHNPTILQTLFESTWYPTLIGVCLSLLCSTFSTHYVEHFLHILMTFCSQFSLHSSPCTSHFICSSDKVRCLQASLTCE